MDSIKIKPAPGRRVRHPETGQVLEDKAIEVPRTSHWLRRLADGDVVETKGSGSSRSSGKGA